MLENNLIDKEQFPKSVDNTSATFSTNQIQN